MKEKAFHCAFGVDANYVKYAGIVMTSIALQNVGHPVVFHLFCKGIHEDDIDKLEKFDKLYKNTEVCLYEITKELEQTDRALGNIGIGRLNSTVLIRLMIPLVISDDVERVLYLDADMLCVNKLDAIWDIDMEGYPIAAVNEGHHESSAKRLNLATDNYLNAGCMLIDVAKWRQMDLTQEILMDFKRNRARYNLLEQDAINHVLQGEFKVISNKVISLMTAFNPYQIFIDKKENVFWHFLNEGKPWFEFADESVAKPYWQVVRKSPWRDMKKLVSKDIKICYLAGKNAEKQGNYKAAAKYLGAVGDRLMEDYLDQSNSGRFRQFPQFYSYTKESPWVSVIIPVCNVEKYLARALDSAVGQTLKEIEIIAVNDGSTDASAEILSEYAEKDERIRIISKENTGYGHTVNVGMDAARGKYIQILEADDALGSDMLEKLVEAAEKNHTEITKADFTRFWGDLETGQKKYISAVSCKNLYNKVQNPQNVNPNLFHCAMMSWCGIILREFVQSNNIRHNETPGASYQDNGFWFQLMCNAERVIFLNFSGYFYCSDNPDSSVRSDKLFAINEEYGFIYGYLSSKKEFAKFRYIYWSKKYNNATFTLHRIKPEFRPLYVQHMRDEFLVAKNKGELSRRCFIDREWEALQLLLSDMDSYLRKYS